MSNRINFSELLGKTLVSIDLTKDNSDSDLIRYTDDRGRVYEQYHEQDCCESVDVKEIVGDLDLLIGLPLVMAEEATNSDAPIPRDGDWVDHFTWTFYKLATLNGYVTISWLGESNGYYSERADTFQVAGPTSAEGEYV